MKFFNVDVELTTNAFFVIDLNLCRVFLKNDKENPWFVLIPRKMNAVELIDLTHEEQCVLMEEVTVVSEFLKSHYRPDKINIATLGNIVKQLHIHVIARYTSDRAWPNAIFGNNPEHLFDSTELENIRSNFLEFYH